MRLEKNHAGDFPVVARSAYVHPTAIVIGNVHIGKKVFVGPLAVIRADEPGADGKIKPIIVEQGTNLQDGVIIHALGGSEVKIGRNTSLAHRALVHGPAMLGHGCFVGFNSTVFKAEIGEQTVIQHHVLIEGVIIPRKKMVPAGAVITCAQDLQYLDLVSTKHRVFARRIANVNKWLTQENNKRVLV